MNFLSGTPHINWIMMDLILHSEYYKPGEGHDNQLQYSCLKNYTDREAWWATAHGVAKSQT